MNEKATVGNGTIRIPLKKILMTPTSLYWRKNTAFNNDVTNYQNAIRRENS